jgi:hypothetical protein
MTLVGTHPDWILNEQLFPDALNALEKNTTNMLDKRASQSDTLASDIDVTGNLSIITGKLNLKPEQVTISDGYFKSSAIMQGFSGPLLYSSVTANLDNVDTVTLVSSISRNQFIKFTGNITTSTSVRISPTAGWEKVFDNQCTGDGYVLLIPVGIGGSSVFIKNGSVSRVYSDGYNLIQSDYSFIENLNNQYITSSGNADDIIASYNQVTNQPIFDSGLNQTLQVGLTNVLKDDFFIVNLKTAIVGNLKNTKVNVRVFYNTSAENITASSIYDSFFVEFTFRVSEFTKTMFVAPEDSSLYTFAIVVTSIAFPGAFGSTIVSPTTLLVEHYRKTKK